VDIILLKSGSRTKVYWEIEPRKNSRVIILFFQHYLFVNPVIVSQQWYQFETLWWVCAQVVVMVENITKFWNPIIWWENKFHIMEEYHLRCFGEPRSWFGFGRWEASYGRCQCHGVECKRSGQHNSIGSCFRDQVQHVEGDNTESLVDETREHLCVEVSNQLIMFKNGVIFVENGRRLQPPWSN